MNHHIQEIQATGNQGTTNTAIENSQSNDESDNSTDKTVDRDIDESYAQFISHMGKITVRGTNTSN